MTREDVEAAARALAAEAGLEVAVEQVTELDGDEDVVPAEVAQPHDDDQAVATDDDCQALPDDDTPPVEADDAPAPTTAQAEPDEADEEALAEQRRAVLATTDALLAQGRQWDHLRAGKETAR